MIEKIPCAIIGPGNIGTDLLIKVMRSKFLAPVWMIGVIDDSQGLTYARQAGLKTSARGIDSVLSQLKDDGIKLLFDATSAKSHKKHAEFARQIGAVMVDLTPAAIGPYCIPVVNPGEILNSGAVNVNMVTCGGQATIPIVAAVSQVQKVKYAEIIATVSSRSAGPGTRKNIDEFTRTTASAIESIGGANEGKAIVIINPADPPIIMRNTIHCLTEVSPDQYAINHSIANMIEKVGSYIPGYTLKNGPVFDGSRVTIYMEVKGLGDYLPEYAGNLDIMTASSVKVAELYARAMITEEFTFL